MTDIKETPLGRRTVLRGLLTLSAGAAVSSVLAACTRRETTSDNPAGSTPTPSRTSATPGSFGTAASTRPLPQDLVAIPQQFMTPSDRQGTLSELTYDTYESMTYEQQTQQLSKRAIVYLPYDYNSDGQYDVFYLMHGGWGNETTTLGTPGSPTDFKNVLDNSIAAGEIKPLIIVCPTYNNTSPEDSGQFGLALTLNQNYHHELLNDLLPAVESTYSSYAENVSRDGLMASRDHRGFGGFSMGAVATWRTFQNAVDYFRYFLPMSCATSLDMENILAGGRERDRADYFVWVITGTDDFAYRYEEARVELMRDSPGLTETENEQDGNFAYRVKDGYAHDGVAASEFTYNGLRWFWRV